MTSLPWSSSRDLFIGSVWSGWMSTVSQSSIGREMRMEVNPARSVPMSSVTVVFLGEPGRLVSGTRL